MVCLSNGVEGTVLVVIDRMVVGFTPIITNVVSSSLT